MNHRISPAAAAGCSLSRRRFVQGLAAGGVLAGFGCLPVLSHAGELSGQLTVRGITQPVRFALLPTECARPAYDCAIRVNGTIRRSQFGMGSFRGTLADKVELDFRIYAQGDAAGSALAPG